MAEQLARLTAPFDAKSSHKYAVAPGQRSYVQQYSHVYNKRAAALRGELEKAARKAFPGIKIVGRVCLLYTSPSPRDGLLSRMPSSA